MSRVTGWLYEPPVSARQRISDLYVLLSIQPPKPDSSRTPCEIHCLLDVSASMYAGGWLDATLDALARFGRQIPEAATFSLTAFAETAGAVFGRASGVCPEAQAAIHGVKNLSLGSGTDLGPVMLHLAGAAEGAASTRYLVISDGSPADRDACLEVASTLEERGVRLDTLQVGGVSGDGFLTALASRCGGRSFVASAPSDIASELARLLDVDEVTARVEEPAIETPFARFTVETGEARLADLVQLAPVARLLYNGLSPVGEPDVTVRELELPHGRLASEFTLSQPLPGTIVIMGALRVPQHVTARAVFDDVALRDASGRHVVMHFAEGIDALAHPGGSTASGTGTCRIDGLDAPDSLCDWLMKYRGLAPRTMEEAPSMDSLPPSREHADAASVADAVGGENTFRVSRDSLLSLVRGAAEGPPPPSSSTGWPSLVIEPAEGAPGEARPRYEFPRTSIVVGRFDHFDGRFPDLDLLPHDPEHTVSRRHARFEWLVDEYYVTDLGSTNGTYLFGQADALAPQRRHALRPGDSVLLGKVHLRLELTPFEKSPAGAG